MFRIPVFFRPEQVSNPRVFSPSPCKPAQVMSDWTDRFADRFEERSFEPVTKDDLYRVHDVTFVNEVLACRRKNGFGTRDLDVAHSLPFTSGSFYAACVEALDGGKAACSPTSGFHHAGHDSAGGFCTFNGLMVAARKLQRERPGLDIGVLDLDEHYGDGTDDIIRRFGLQSTVHHWTLGSSQVERHNAQRFVDTELRDIVRDLHRSGARLLMYQAGADCHINDPLGGRFTDDQLRQRDRVVFETCKELGLPVAWNLAGGYQRDASGSIEKVLRIHRATMEECIRVYG